MDEYCECICHYIWTMRRLFASLQSQTQCTDTECFTEHPGYEGGAAPDPSTTIQLVLVLLLWVVIAIVLFRFRPRGLRGSGSGKPSLPNSSNERKPPPSPPTQ